MAGTRAKNGYGLSSAEWKRRARAQRGEQQTEAARLNKRMGYYLRDSRKRLEHERYVTAFFGIATSWERIFEHAKYCLTSES